MLSRFSIHNGCLKYTHARRFDDFDSLAFRAIATNSVARQHIRVHDIGVSDGRTCCGLYDHLNSLYGDRLTFVASDYYPFLCMLKRRNSKRRLIVDDQHRILQIVTPPFVFNAVRPESIKLYPLNHLIRHLTTIFYARPLLEAYRAKGGDVEKTRLELLSYECRAYLARENNFHFERYDVLSGPTEPFDIIRAMNLLKCNYFGEADLKRAVRNIYLSLNEDGLFITGSNMERGTIVDGGIYRKVRGQLQVLEKSGKGSQVHALIVAGSEWPDRGGQG